VRDANEYLAFQEYIHLNPVKRRLVNAAAEYSYSSACAGYELDGFPQRLKPIILHAESQR
jgi:hypothetical protein